MYFHWFSFYLSLAIRIHSCQSLVLQCSLSRLNPDESSCQKRKNSFMDYTSLPSDLMGLKAKILQFYYCSRKYVPSLQKFFYIIKADFKRWKFHTVFFPPPTKNTAIKREMIAKMKQTEGWFPLTVSERSSYSCKTDT